MAKLSDNKILDAAKDSALRKWLLEGHWPEVKYHESAGCRGMSLYEWVAVSDLWRKCLHIWLREEKGFGMGIYEQKRSADWKAMVEGYIAQMRPAHKEDLVEGRPVMLSAVECISKQARRATVGEAEYMPCIFDIQMEERDGYCDDYGSAYTFEVLAVKVNGIWCPYEPSAEERAFEKTVYGGNMGAAQVAGRMFGG